MDFPGFENIFSLSEPFATRPYRGSLHNHEFSTSDFFALAWGALMPSRPVRIVPYGGRVPSDFIWTGAVVIRLISNRVCTLLRSSGFPGWSTYPVSVYDRENRVIEGYEGLAVTGRCGKIDPALSTPFPKKMPGGVFPYFKGYLFDPTSWDGSHFFSPEGTGPIFVTQPVHDVMRSEKVKNVAYQPITEMDYGEYEKTLFEKRLAQP